MAALRINPAIPGENHYVIDQHGQHIVLSRTSSKGRAASIAFTRADVITVANALVDLLEQEQETTN
ncbi:hypothetical protein C0J29_08490 [Mycobacterium paragordonae]|uniref:Uncharacterized protein n=1 Tax=Mycobacterium paragordonae TaxID=1389713 RepID=A0ABQ1C0E7_9MYCO|nr:hypothetical protein [Mycobacterium paragordonae]AYE94813.1 hypothetical protein C0J29_08490 [Mycobacterium paragordonae]GFG77905.1 hypothetical protein MPRG_11810 [Mycobacterium paragordonae]